MTKQEFIDSIQLIKKLSSKPHSEDTVAYATIWHLAYKLEKHFDALIKEAQEKARSEGHSTGYQKGKNEANIRNKRGF